LSYGGVFSVADAYRILGGRLGPIRGLRFLSPREGRNIVRWIAVTDSGEIIGGRLVVRAGMTGLRVQAWLEIEIEPAPKQSKTAAAGPRARLLEVANRAREIIRTVRERPTYGPAELVGALVGIVDIAEGDEADESDR
jgi:hypothetical protein